MSGDVALGDGFFEVLLIRMPRNPLKLSNIATYLLMKEERKENELVYRFKAKRLKVEAEEDVDWVLDGEFGGKRREVEIVNLEKRVHIVRG